MGFPVRALGLGAAWAVALTSCSVPTDKSKDIMVVVRLSDSLAARGVLGRGARDSVFAVAIRQSTGDTVRNVDFTWVSGNDNILTVQGSVSGSAEITGVNTGTASVQATAVAFQDAQAGQAAIRVAPAFVIDSVRPLSVRYGQKVTVYGVGVPSLFFLDLGFADLIKDEFSLVGSGAGLGAQDYWVPAPAFSDSLVYALFSGGQIILGSVDSITVDSRDVFEPSDSSPAVIDLNGPGGPRTFGAAADPVLFFNPALFFEPPLYFYSEDWYQFARSDQATPLSFILEQDGLTDTGFVYLADSIAWGGGGGYQILPATSMISNAGLFVCNGTPFFTNASRTIRSVFPLVRPWAPSLQLLAAIQGGSVGYGMEVVKGYVSDARLPRDRFETDDLWCKYADQRFAASNDSTSVNRLHIVVGLPGFGQNGPWLDQLAIERPGDIDWIRFRVQPAVLGPDTMTTVQTKSLPLGPSDQSDIDVYVMRASDFAFMGASTNVGSAEALTLRLPAADYYLGVVDVAGTTTKYSLCVAKATACTPPGATSAAFVAENVRRLPPRTPHDPRELPPGFTGPVRRSP